MHMVSLSAVRTIPLVAFNFQACLGLSQLPRISGLSAFAWESFTMAQALLEASSETSWKAPSVSQGGGVEGHDEGLVVQQLGHPLV